MIAFWGIFFRPASDVNISKTVHPIYLKIKVQRVLTSHSSYINFQVNRINRSRDIVVGSWPKKKTQKTRSFLPTLSVPLYHVYSTASHVAIKNHTMLTGIILYYLVT